MKLVLSSGHGLKIRGASGFIDEVDEARRVVETVAKILRFRKVEVVTFHDDVSTTQDENLKRIVDFHNAQGPHDLDASVHFNAYETTEKPMGSECWYLSAESLAQDLATAMAAAAELPDRGAKYSDSLYFLAHTKAAAVLLEVVFVDSATDADHFDTKYNRICWAIAGALIGRKYEMA